MLRIRKRKLPLLGLDSAPGSGGTDQFDTYLGRLVKLIPSEVIALYLVGRGFLPRTDGRSWIVWTIVGVVAVVVVRASVTRNPQKGVGAQWPAVTISSVSFLVWVYSLGDVFGIYGINIPYIGSLLVLTWTFFIPYLYDGD
jgi:hypothetical protein